MIDEPGARVLETDGSLRDLSAGDFRFGDRPASLAIAFISPHVDFAATIAALQQSAGATPLMASSTAGELCGASPGAPLYKPTGASWSSVVVLVLSADLLAQVSLHAVPLHNEDIRRGEPALSGAERVERILGSLAEIKLPFRLDARDSVALTLIDGLSACENYLMEAIYRSGAFPCLFVGGSSGGKLDLRHTSLFDGKRILENHALIAFLKLAPGKRYGVLKSQNFKKTGHSFIVVDAVPDRRTVSTMLDGPAGVVVPAVTALSKFFGVGPEGLAEKLTGYTFAIELDGELFVRSVAAIDLESGGLTFFCDVNQGEELLLVETTDFAEQTRRDVAEFLRDKPRPLAAVLNDCILRRLNNKRRLDELAGLWSMPVAGFSTFGELLGININQTLTALVFFDAGDGPFEDDFIDSFPVHYARFCSYFERRHLNRIKIMNRLRSGMARHLAANLGGGSVLTEEFESLLSESTDIRSTLAGIHATLAREAAREQEVRALKTRYELILGAAGDGIIGIDTDETITFANDAACRMLGTGRAALEGRNYRIALCGSAEESDFPAFPLETREGRESLFRRGDGDFVAEYVMAPMRQMGYFGGAVLVFRDISLRKYYEESIANQQRELELQVAERTQALAESKERLIAITESLVVGVLLVDDNGIVAFANKAAHLCLGCDRLVGRELDEVLVPEIGGEAKRFSIGPFRRVIEKGETIIDDDAVFLIASGRRLSIAYAAAPLVEEGQRHTAILSFRDIEALKKAQREAQQVSRLVTIGQLAAGIAHEINTPVQYVGNNLTYISQSLTVLESVIRTGQELVAAAGTPRQEERHAEWETAIQAAQLDFLWQELPAAAQESLDGVAQITRIVNSMKEFSHPGTTSKAMIDVNHAIDSTLTVCRNIWKMVAEVDTDFDADLPPVQCFGSEMNQVYLNLIVNAAQAIESSGKKLPGRITVTTRRDGDFVTIEVADSGTGIPEELRERIFDPFFTTKEVGKGTGQGLAICRDVVVSKHGGTLEAGGIAGEGAIFTVRLPIGSDSSEIQ